MILPFQDKQTHKEKMKSRGSYETEHVFCLALQYSTKLAPAAQISAQTLFTWIWLSALLFAHCHCFWSWWF